jgi:hypothetical protein
MKVYQVRGYPDNHYFVKTFQEFLDIISWMTKNDIKYLHEYSGPHGYGFSVREKNIAWIALKWL